jgi:meckelin
VAMRPRCLFALRRIVAFGSFMLYCMSLHAHHCAGCRYTGGSRSCFSFIKSNPHTVLTSAGGGTSRTTEWLFFGTNDKESFSCALDTLLTKEQMFYELFIHGKDESYTPVPVRITNIARTTSAKVNVKYPTVPLCESADVLTRRFFLYDVVSGVTSVNSANQPVTTVIRYASYISLEASLVTNKFARIYAPVLTITYEEVKPANWPANPADRIDFNMAYTMTMDEFFVNFRTFFIIIMVFTGLLFALRYRNWQIRNARVVTSAALTTDLGGFNMSTIIEMCLYASSTWVLVFFPVTACIAWYAFTFFKIQSAPSVLLPPERDVYSPDSPYYLFVVNIHVMAFFQLFNVLVLVYRQCRADLFFVDWEPLPTKQPTASGASKGSVSVWRTILVANEWTELQTVRKTDIRFTLFFLGFVLLGELPVVSAVALIIRGGVAAALVTCGFLLSVLSAV